MEIRRRAPDDPIQRFLALLERARATPQIAEPTAMTLATVGADGRPSARVVLLKGADEDGLVFYTNLESRKGREALARPDVALVFWWGPLESQVRFEGRAERVSDEEADAYFATRPRGSQWGCGQHGRGSQGSDYAAATDNGGCGVRDARIVTSHMRALQRRPSGVDPILPGRAGCLDIDEPRTACIDFCRPTGRDASLLRVVRVGSAMSEHVRLADHFGNADPVLMALAWRDGTSSRS